MFRLLAPNVTCRAAAIPPSLGDKRTLPGHRNSVARDPERPSAARICCHAQYKELAAKIESCRKFILASRIAMAGGGIVLAAMFLGAIRFDPAAMATAVAALLGGIVVWGSNGSTAREAAKELAAAEADRAALIEMIDLHVIGPLR
jgi:hypothetical protein